MGKDCISEVLPLLPFSFQYEESNELLWCGGIQGNIWLNDLQVGSGCIVWSRVNIWVSLPGSLMASSLFYPLLLPTPFPGHTPVIPSAPFHPFLGLSGSFLFPSPCSVSSAQVPQRGRVGGSSGGCLSLAGGGTARAQVWAGLSGKLQQAKGSVGYSRSWFRPEGKQGKMGPYGAAMGGGKKPWLSHFFMYLLPTEFPWLQSFRSFLSFLLAFSSPAFPSLLCLFWCAPA